MTIVAERCHVIAEGAAACAVAAALSGRARGRIVAIVSGGNIDLTTFASLTSGRRIAPAAGAPSRD
jgi:threonine dehydratase